jgi:hypothetical protein
MHPSVHLVLNETDQNAIGSMSTVDDGWLVVNPPAHENLVEVRSCSSTLPVRIIVRNPTQLIALDARPDSLIYVEATSGARIQVACGGRLVVTTGADGQGDFHILGALETLELRVDGSAAMGTGNIRTVNAAETAEIAIVGGSGCRFNLAAPQLKVLKLDSTIVCYAGQIELLRVSGNSTLVASNVLRANRLFVDDAAITRLSASVLQVVGIDGPTPTRFEAMGDGCALFVATGSPDVQIEGDCQVQLGSAISGWSEVGVRRATIDAPSSSLRTTAIDGLRVNVGLLEVHSTITRLSGCVGHLLCAGSPSIVADQASALVINGIGPVDGAELAGISPYELRLADLQALSSARAVQFRFAKGKEHRRRLRVMEERVGGSAAASLFWFRIGRLLDEHGGTGAARAVARSAEHEFRRRSLRQDRTQWWRPRTSTERVGLSAYRLLGYGDSIVRPLAAHVLIGVGLAIVTCWHAGHLIWPVLGKLLLQPIRFLLRDEAFFKLSTSPEPGVTRIPNGLWSQLAPPIVQVAGTLMVATAANAIRRLVKGR